MEAGSCEVKFAATVVLAPRVIVQVPVPLQPPPDQPKKLAPGLACGVKVTLAPLK